MELLAISAQVAGAVGDAFTFAGGYMLALDLVERDRNAERDRAFRVYAMKALSRGISVVRTGTQINDEGDVERSADLYAVVLGKRGLRLLAIGLSFLALYRVLEITSLFTAPHQL